MNVARGAGGNGRIGKNFLKLELLLGWDNSLLAYYSLDFQLRRGFISQKKKKNHKPGNLWQRRKAAGMTLRRPKCWGLAGQMRGLWASPWGTGAGNKDTAGCGEGGDWKEGVRSWEKTHISFFPAIFQTGLFGSKKKLVQYQEVLGTAAHQLLERTWN